MALCRLAARAPLRHGRFVGQCLRSALATGTLRCGAGHRRRASCRDPLAAPKVVAVAAGPCASRSSVGRVQACRVAGRFVERGGIESRLRQVDAALQLERRFTRRQVMRGGQPRVPRGRRCRRSDRIALLREQSVLSRSSSDSGCLGLNGSRGTTYRDRGGRSGYQFGGIRRPLLVALGTPSSSRPAPATRMRSAVRSVGASNGGPRSWCAAYLPNSQARPG